MSKIRLDKRDFISTVILTVVGLLFVAMGLMMVGNQPESYNDFIVETVAYFDMNMSGELKVFWAVLIIGVILLLILNWMLRRMKSEPSEKLSVIIKIETTLGVASFVYLMVTGSVQVGIAFVMIGAFLNYLVSPEKQKEGLILNIVTYMAIYGGVTALNWVGMKIALSGTLIMIITILFDIVILSIDRKKEIFNKVFGILQVLVPLGLLSYVNERYSLNGTIMKVGYSLQVRVIFAMVILVMMGWAIYKLIKNWKIKDAKLPKMVLLSTTIATCLVLTVGNETGLILPSDLHHTGENVISYQQIVGQGQEVYVDYSPVSGLFPMFMGGILEMIGGNMTEYNMAIAMFMMIVVGLTVWILSKHLEMDDALIASCCFIFTGYNRAFFMPMTLLVLFLPRLIRKRNLWLKVWILIIMMQGIYYPSFGGAALIGTLPIGIYQIVMMMREGEFKKLVKTWRFYVGWVVTLVSVVMCLPLILRIAKHVMLYAKQTTLADGTAVFGQSVPANFLPYLDEGALMIVRQSLYYAIRYVIPMIVVWVLILMLVKAWRKRRDNIWTVGVLMALIIILVVAFSGTMVREDFGGIVGRIMSLITPGVGIILYIIFRKYARCSIYNYILIGGLVGLTMVNGCSAFLNLTKSTKYANVVSGDFVQISKEMRDNYLRLGDGFASTTALNMINDYGERAKNLLQYDENLKFIGWGELGVYYVLDISTVGQPSLYAAKDYATNQEIIDAVKEQRPVVGLYIPNISPGLLSAYYFYNWIYTTEDYVYDDNYEAFLPIELFRKIYGEEAKPDKKTEAILKTTDAGKVASSLGSSIATLEESALTEYEVSEKIHEGVLDLRNNTYTYTVTLPEEILGENVDMVYIDFEVNENVHEKRISRLDRIASKQWYNEDIRVEVSWGDKNDEKQGAELGRGDLLMPLGANSEWLMNEHEKITVVIMNVTEPIKINDIKFYKLKK